MKLLSANIEGDRHLERVVPFVKMNAPDIICLQEVFESDLVDILDPDWHRLFLPMTLKKTHNGQLGAFGIAIATRFPVNCPVRAYYYQLEPAPLSFNEKDKRATCWHGVAGFDITAEVGTLTVFVTHFTWTPHGVSDANQEADMPALIAIMQRQKPHILCGDFNIPRKQNKMYSELVRHYSDCVPQHFTCSLDLSLHYAGRKPNASETIGQYMVDYVLSNSDRYRIENMEMHSGLSDHYLLTADVQLL